MIRDKLIYVVAQAGPRQRSRCASVWRGSRAPDRLTIELIVSGTRLRPSVRSTPTFRRIASPHCGTRRGHEEYDS